MLTASLFVATLLISAPGELAANSLSAADSSPLPAAKRLKKSHAPFRATPRPMAELTKVAYETLRAEASAATPLDSATQAKVLCELYAELARDPRLEASETLTDLHRLLGVRLANIKARVSKQLQATDAGRESNYSRSSTLPAGGALQRAAQGAVARRGGGALEDYGQELVELIEATVSSGSWEVNGGRSTIFYYAPLRALVVSAPEEVHGNVGGLLGGLRAAGQ